MPAQSTDTADQIVQRLRALAQESPDLQDPAVLYEAILPLLRDADLHGGAIALTTEQVSEKMEKGQPLLSDLELDLDVEAARELMIMLAAAVEKAGRKMQTRKLRMPWFTFSSEPGSAAAHIRVALQKGTLDAGELLPFVAAGVRGPVMAAAKDLQLDPGLLLTLAQNALKPALRSWCSQLSPLAKGSTWGKGTCFVCGAPATLAELQGNSQERHLRCGSCGADWIVSRLECAHCGNEDHRTLRTLYDDAGRERMQVEACDTCKGYLKVISSFSPTPRELLPIEDLATIHLDYIAQENGYSRTKTAAPS